MASLLVGSLGLALLMYGKKQARVPQIAAGLLLLFSSYVAPSAGWMMASGAALVALLWFAVTQLGW